MMRNLLVPMLAIGMILFATGHILSRQQPTLQQRPVLAPAEGRYDERVAGTGLVEPKTENIRVGSHLPGIVERVYVSAGARVRPGDPLFDLDARQVQSQLRVKQAELAVAQAELARLDQLPRPEDIPPVEAQRREAEARVTEMKDEYERQQTLHAGKATSTQELISSREQFHSAVAQLERVEAEERRLRAGAWEADKVVSRAKIEQVRGEIEQLETELSRHTVTVPHADKDGRTTKEFQVLQVKVRPGEAVTVATDAELITLGAVDRKHVRVDIDEHDIPRFSADSPAVGIVRGQTQIEYPLSYVRIEPFVVPKRSLTGDNTERVDTRVLQVIFAIDETNRPPVFVGQQMDVFVSLSAPPSVGALPAGRHPIHSARP